MLGQDSGGPAPMEIDRIGQKGEKGKSKGKSKDAYTSMSRAWEREMARIRKEKERASRKARTMARAKVNRRVMPRAMDRKAKKAKEMVDLSRHVIRVANLDILPVIAGEYDRPQTVHPSSSSRVKVSQGDASSTWTSTSGSQATTAKTAAVN